MLHILAPWGCLVATYLIGSVAIVYLLLFHGWELSIEDKLPESWQPHSSWLSGGFCIAIAIVISLLNHTIFSASQDIMQIDILWPWIAFAAGFSLCAATVFGAVVGMLTSP